MRSAPPGEVGARAAGDDDSTLEIDDQRTRVAAAPERPARPRSVDFDDDETRSEASDKTVVRGEPAQETATRREADPRPGAAASKDLFSEFLDAPAEPMTLPVGAVVAPAPLLAHAAVPAPPVPLAAVAAPAPAVVAVPVVAAPVLTPAPSAGDLFAAAVEEPEDDEDRAERTRAGGPQFPCTLRRYVVALKDDANLRGDAAAVGAARCLRDVQAQGVLLGERLVPENFVCHADHRVEYAEAAEQPSRNTVELYLAPELFLGRPPSPQSDVFAAGAIVYELLTGRSLKPMYLPKVLQTSKTDTWFRDPGQSMREEYRLILRKALSTKASERQPDMATFSHDLVRAWRLARNPERRRAEPDKPTGEWPGFVKPLLIIAAFALVILALLLFPVGRLAEPDMPTVRPELAP